MAEQKVREAAVIIVGAGSSGLATAACLSHLSVPYILLEREDCFASIWKKYSYDRLHLHLAKQFSELPLLPIPASYPTYISRTEFVQYLNDYVSHFGIHPILRQAVEKASYDEVSGEWNVKARDYGSDEVKEYRSRFLVVATGESCDAFRPEIEGLQSFNGEILHSTQYKNGDKFKDKSVLVVGSGNSGMEISLDLANYGAKTSIVVRSPIHILSKWMMRMVGPLFKFLSLDWIDSIMVIMSKIVYGDLSKYGIERPNEGPFATKKKYGKYPIIDVGTCRKIKSQEIQVLPGVKRVRGTNIVIFENGQEYAFDAIVLATGFKRSTKEWLEDQGCRVFVTPNVKPSADLMLCLIEAVHGEAIKDIDNTLTEDESIPDDLLFISSEEDYTMCVPFLKKGTRHLLPKFKPISLASHLYLQELNSIYNS